jgi:DNA repair and recombination protein RAD52
MNDYQPQPSHTSNTNPSIIKEYTLEEQKKLAYNLSKCLGPEFIAKRQGPGGSTVQYLEGWKVIALANDILGFNGWSHSIMNITVDYVNSFIYFFFHQ